MSLPLGGLAPRFDDDADLRTKIVQVLFTAPGERVNQPEFGCGLFNLVFDHNNPITAAAAEFTIGQALTRWLGDELVVSAVDVQGQEEMLLVEIDYVRRKDMSRRAVQLHFG
ncbi:GPW/gp25 family protein [Nonomuraea sp. NPDC048826]|uniref:GPW/gp25 family protein n=1 Tax=Nonomuraea sp. NPDC048826 TaxID=3364347 RepID=UPI0037107EC3